MKKEYQFPILLMLSIFLGSLLGLFFYNLNDLFWDLADYVIFILVFLLIFEVPFERLLDATKDLKFISITWVTNFIILPSIGFIVASIFLSGYELFFIGLIIYFMAPCTDWFLGFIKIAKGNTSLGTILIPINIITQLLLYPVYIYLFTNNKINIQLDMMFETLFFWFILPLILAVGLHFLFKKIFSNNVNKKIFYFNNSLVEFVLIVLVFLIFASHIQVMIENLNVFFLILISVFVFFVIVYFLTEMISKYFKINYENHVLFTITTSARNAPLMLALTAIVFPDQPLIYAGIIVGMLVEFPHLGFITGLLLKKKKAY